MVPAAPLRKKFHSGMEILLAVFMISPHSMKLKTSLSFSNRPLHNITKRRITDLVFAFFSLPSTLHQ